MISLAIVLALSHPALIPPALLQEAPSIQSFVQSNLRDGTFVAKVLHGDQQELKKINQDFGQSYLFDTTRIYFKEPFKLRLEATVEDTHILYIMNGPIQYIKVPRSHINSRQDLEMKPGRRQTVMDFGILTPSLFDGLYDAKFVRWDRASGDAVFDLTYVARLGDSSRSRIWIDKQHKFIVKREWYNQSGRQLATFYYDNPQNESGVWMPTRLTVKNVEDKVAGVTAYESVSVNGGLDDALFKG